MKSLIVTFTAQNTKTNEFLTSEIDVTINTDLDEILNEILEENDITEDTEDWELSTELESNQEIHATYLNTSDIFEYAEAYENSSYDLNVLNAGIECGIDLDNIDEAYSGKHDSDEDFAENMADELGYMNDAKSWPFTCIDWEQAAKELMYDYSDSYGHYFRNL